MFGASDGGKMITFQNLSRLHESIASELREAFEKVLKTSAFIQGPFVTQFEKEFAAYTGAPFCLGVANGTDAIEIVLEASGIKAGDLVAVPSMTFAATAEAVVRCGATPLFVDVDHETLCMSDATLETALKNSKQPIKAVMPVHLYGRACDMQSLSKAAARYGAFIIEDCAQAQGARLDGKHVGTFGAAGTFSFYPGKNLGALGDAGAIVTISPELYERMKMLRDHGRTQKYLHESIGRNSRLDGLQAAFLSVKLKHLENWTAKRRALAQTYHAGLRGIDGVMPITSAASDSEHVYHLFVVRVTKPGRTRDELAVWLKEKGIETGVHYPLGVHMQPAFKAYAGAASFPVTEQAVKEILSLPMDPLMQPTEVERVCAEIRHFYE